MFSEGGVGVRVISEKQHFGKIEVVPVYKRSRKREGAHLWNSVKL